MILSDPHGRSATPGIGGRATLDDLFRRAATRRPEAVALVDPLNRDTFTDGPARSLTYAEADRMISAIAGRLRRIGLNTDAIVGLQLANTIESVLALLAVLRAGMIAMPMPLLWRRADAIGAFRRVGGSALIVNGRIGRHDQYDMALQIAAESFTLRFICGFGEPVPDGVIPLDDLFTAQRPDPYPPLEHFRSASPGPAAHVAAITWDVSADGLIPVARNHAELIAAGLAVVLEGRLKQDASILATLATSSFAGLAITLLPWLLIGGTLVFHHPFESSAFLAQQRSFGLDAIVVPGPLVAQLVDAGYLTGGASVIGVWRAPDRLPRAFTWRNRAMIDVQVFGEIGLIPARRGVDGRPGLVPFGALAAPRGSRDGIMVGEIRPTAHGSVAMRGPMVPRCPFPAGVERTVLPHLKVAPTGFVDTGYACWTDRERAPLVVTGPPAGMVSVGGYRFLTRDLQERIGKVEADATLAALPDALTGHRLAGAAADVAGMQQTLSTLGVNPLLVDAFRERGPEALAVDRRDLLHNPLTAIA